MENILEVKDLCKSYVQNAIQNNVLKNVSFNIKDGEYIAIMGPSGSGKSTLLYTVSGMDDLTSGSVKLCGREIENLNDREISNMRLKEMGFVFQQMNMLKNLSIYDNIILPAYSGQKRSNRKEINQRAKELMHQLGILELANSDITAVSGGELQRACICRSLINNPKIIFADEPTGALNSKNSNEVMNQFTKINGLGTTILLVTHDARVASKCDKIMYICDGYIKGEMVLGKYKDESNLKTRESKLTNWLSEMGW